MKNKKLIIFTLFIIIVLIIFLSIFIKNDYKIINFGNNISIKNAEQIKSYILNISSYEAQIEVQVKSNKNENKYIINEKYVSPNISKQEVLEPENIQGLTTTYDGKDLKIENTKLNLSTIYENYNYIASNDLCLSTFIDDYNNNQDSQTQEDENQVIMQTKSKNEQNKYWVSKKLYIDKKTTKPTKLEIQDINQNTLVYILYNEIKINSIKTEDVVAFKLNKGILEI